MTGAIRPEPWMADAACAQVDPDLWFPEQGQNPEPAKRICNTICPVQTECLAYALADTTLVGIWGGVSTRARAPMRRNTA